MVSANTLTRHADHEASNEVWDGMRADYSAGKQTRFQKQRLGLPAGGGSADFHFRDEHRFFLRIEQSRDMDRNDVLGKPLIDRATDNYINGGFDVDPDTGDEGLDTEFRERWREESNDARFFDVQAERTFRDMEWETARAITVDGDIFALLRDDDRVQLIEAHQIRNPAGRPKNMVLGIALNKMRQRIGAAIGPDHLNPMHLAPRQHEMNLVPMWDNDGFRRLIHAYTSTRTTQTRGMTAFAPIFDYMGMFDDNNFAQLVKQQMSACVAIIEEKTAAWQSDPNSGGGGATAKEGVYYDDVFGRYLESWRPGQRISAPLGTKLTGFSPNVPNSNWFEHMTLIMQLMAINLGMPLEMLLLDGSRTNFSGWRGAKDQAKIGFQRFQKRLCRRFHEPIWYWKVRQWLRNDSIIRQITSNRSKINPYRHKWNFPGWPYIEPHKDAQADAFQQNNLLNSPRRIQANRGRDHRQIVTETISDNGFAIETAAARAAEINASMPEGQPHVTWHDVLRLPTADKVSLSFSKAMNEDEPTAPQRGNNAA